MRFLFKSIFIFIFRRKHNDYVNDLKQSGATELTNVRVYSSNKIREALSVGTILYVLIFSLTVGIFSFFGITSGQFVSGAKRFIGHMEKYPELILIILFAWPILCIFGLFYVYIYKTNRIKVHSGSGMAEDVFIVGDNIYLTPNKIGGSIRLLWRNISHIVMLNDLEVEVFVKETSFLRVLYKTRSYVFVFSDSDSQLKFSKFYSQLKYNHVN